MKRGCVYLVGAGPGDPDLITVKGKRLVEEADVVVYDYLASPRLLDYALRTADLVYVGKKAGAHIMKQEDINELLVRLCREGKKVVRLKGGDPYVFGRGGEEALALAKAGLTFEVVPGVTSGIAGPTYAGIPVTHRGLASNVGFVTGHETPDKEDSDLDYAALAKWRGTLVFYMGVKNLESISRGLTGHGMDESTPAALIHWGTTWRQRVVTGVIGNIAELGRQVGIAPPTLLVVGAAVGLRERLNWFENRALFGRRIVVTRSRAQASGLGAELARLGAEVIELPTIRTEAPVNRAPLEKAVRELERYDWVIFNSVNAVNAFFGALIEAGLDARALAGVCISCVGTATAERLREFGLVADLVPARFDSRSLVETFRDGESLKGKRVLCPRADIAPGEFIDGLASLGAEVVEVVAYRTVGEEIGQDEIEELLSNGGPDWITFTSSSTVENFFATLVPERIKGLKTRLASIGPLTSQRIRRFGLEPAVEAQPHTIAALVEAMLRFGKATGNK